MIRNNIYKQDNSRLLTYKRNTPIVALLFAGGFERKLMRVTYVQIVIARRKLHAKSIFSSRKN